MLQRDDINNGVFIEDFPIRPGISVYLQCSLISTVALKHLNHFMVTDFIVSGSNRPDNMIVRGPFILRSQIKKSKQNTQLLS